MHEKTRKFEALAEENYQNCFQTKSDDLNNLILEQDGLENYHSGLIEFKETKQAELELKYRNLRRRALSLKGLSS